MAMLHNNLKLQNKLVHAPVMVVINTG